jgi:hypothetical protein
LIQVLTARKQAGDESATAALELPTTLGQLSQAKALSLADLLRDVQTMSRDCSASKTTVRDVIVEGGLPSLQELQLSAERRVSAVEIVAQEAKSACEKLAGYFGEGPELATSVIGILADFVEALSNSKVKLQQQELKAKRQKLNSGKKV